MFIFDDGNCLYLRCGGKNVLFSRFLKRISWGRGDQIGRREYFQFNTSALHQQDVINYSSEDITILQQDGSHKVFIIDGEYDDWCTLIDHLFEDQLECDVVEAGPDEADTIMDEIDEFQHRINGYEAEINAAMKPAPSRIRQLQDWIRGAKKSIRRLQDQRGGQYVA
jgi:hypothetical protein